MTDPTFACNVCGRSFSVAPQILARYPGWQPTQCLECRQRGAKAAKSPRPAPSGRRHGSPGSVRKTRGSELDRVLDRYEKGPTDGVFTDGACSGNPGPGGWAVVRVEANEVLEERHGTEPHTTNNRMELRALIEAYRMLPEDAEVVVWSDSNLCVRTINEWAAEWQRRGWKRKTGPVENLDLVREAFRLARSRPRVTLRWIRGHDGSRWNEYADLLATAPLRGED